MRRSRSFMPKSAITRPEAFPNLFESFCLDSLLGPEREAAAKRRVVMRYVLIRTEVGPLDQEDIGMNCRELLDGLFGHMAHPAVKP